MRRVGRGWRSVSSRIGRRFAPHPDEVVPRENVFGIETSRCRESSPPPRLPCASPSRAGAESACLVVVSQNVSVQPVGSGGSRSGRTRCRAVGTRRSALSYARAVAPPGQCAPTPLVTETASKSATSRVQVTRPPGGPFADLVQRRPSRPDQAVHGSSIEVRYVLYLQRTRRPEATRHYPTAGPTPSG